MTREGEETEIELKIRKDQERMKDIEKFADSLITTSPDDIKCMKHIQSDMDDDCNECKSLKEKAKKYQSHNHTFTCAKKKKTITDQKKPQRP